MLAKNVWYADGLRWIGSILNGAADHLERNAAEPLEPRPPLPQHRAIDEYVSDVRHRIHVHF